MIPSVKYSLSEHDDDILLLIALFQYVLRLYLVFSLNSKIVEVTGAFSKTAWQGAAYNLLLYMIASHVRYSCDFSTILLLSPFNTSWHGYFEFVLPFSSVLLFG